MGTVDFEASAGPRAVARGNRVVDRDAGVRRGGPSGSEGCPRDPGRAGWVRDLRPCTVLRRQPPVPARARRPTRLRDGGSTTTPRTRRRYRESGSLGGNSASAGSWSRTSGASVSRSPGSTYGGLLTTRSIRPARWSTGSSRSPWWNATRPSRPRRRAFSCATARAGAEMSVACTSASFRSPASESAMQPEPVPTSTISGRSTAFSEIEARLDEQLGLRARDQDGGRDEELVPPEGLGAEDVLQGLAGSPSPDERAEALRLRRPGPRDPGSRRALARSQPRTWRNRRSASHSGAGTPAAASASRRASATSAAAAHGEGAAQAAVVALSFAAWLWAMRLDTISSRSPSRISCRRWRVRPMRWSVTRACWKL